jgi:hypothetical protein
MFESIYHQPEYINIINALENAKNVIINLNNNLLLDNTYYGKTTTTIIDNIKKVNTLDIIKFNNEDYDLYNKMALELYGNNSSLISNSVIQGLVVNIYNYPIISYLPNRKISSDLIEYLNNIPIEFNNQISYINNNSDYLLLTNKNSCQAIYFIKGDPKSPILYYNNVIELRGYPMLRDRLIQVRVHGHELNQIRQNATSGGFHHLSDYIRSQALQGIQNVSKTSQSN